MNKYIFLLTLFAVFIISCGKEAPKMIKDRIINYIEKNPDSTIAIKQFTDFKWDKMYLFNEGASQFEINKTLGFNYNEFTEFSRTMLFVRDNQIVHKEEEKYNTSGRPSYSLWFKFEDSFVKIMMFTPLNAIFRIEKIKIDNKVYYELIPIQVKK